MSTPNLTRRELCEVQSADLSRRIWVRGSGKVFWANAVRHAKPEHLPKIVAAMEAARTKGAPSARTARPHLTA